MPVFSVTSKFHVGMLAWQSTGPEVSFSQTGWQPIIETAVYVGI